MRIGKISIENFQSYKNLEFDYESLGLSLVSGQTGSGKSGLLDAPAWILYGITSKDSAADDVRSWFAEHPTKGTASVLLPDGEIHVTRIRGNAKQNDLFWIESNEPDVPRRGKDITDTQRRLEARLGVNSELFVIGSYLHQFSRADGFFVAKAKDRRDTMEKIADQELAIKLGDRASEMRKITKKDLEDKRLLKEREHGKYEETKRSHDALLQSSDRWNQQKAVRISDLRTKAERFEADKNAQVDKIVSQLEELDKITVSPSEFESRELQIKQQLIAFTGLRKNHTAQTTRLADLKARVNSIRAEQEKVQRIKGDMCPTCMGPTNNPNRSKHIEHLSSALKDVSEAALIEADTLAKIEKALEAEEKVRKAYDKCKEEKSNNDRLLDKFESLQAQARSIRTTKNTYAEQADQAETEKNPFIPRIDETAKLIADGVSNMGRHDADIEALERRVVGLTWLYDKSFELRGILMTKAVRQINQATNKYLERYFDANLRVQFRLSDSDKLDVEINNNGYICPYKQLSGGERRMLTLAFSISLMQAAQNKAGVDFSMIMLDEALNGLDDGLKVKAFGLLQELENDYSSVVLIDHCEEFKNLFGNRFEVTNVGYSEIRHLV